MLKQAIFTPSRAIRSSLRTPVQRTLLQTKSAPSPFSSIRPIQVTSTRWYSSETEPTSKDSDKSAAEQGAKPKEGEASELETLKKQLETKDKEVRDWKDKAMRTVADFRNLQDRTARDMKQARDFAIQKFAKDLIDSVDNLDRALSMGQEKIDSASEAEINQDLKSFYDGVKMTDSILIQTLAKHGLERFSPEGEKFNPNEHEATFMTPMPDKEDGSVFHVQQKGFKLNGRVLRAAKVGVAKNK